MSDKGYVYILTNKAFKDNWVKIGMTAREPNVRSAELDNTAIPIPYEVYATLKTAKYRETEHFIHKMIDRLSDLRIRPNREFFNISPEEAYSIFEDVARLLDDAELVKSVQEPEDDSEDSETYQRRGPGRFDKIGCKVGTILYLKDKPECKCKVFDGRNKVEYENEIYSVSGWAAKMLDCESINGYEHIMIEGENKTLWQKRLELEAVGKYTV